MDGRAAIARATPYPEGRRVFVPVTSQQDVADVQALLALRAEAKRIPRRMLV